MKRPNQSPEPISTICDTTTENSFYEEVAQELQSEKIIAGLWTKAFAEADGEMSKTRAIYIKYRVAQLAATANQAQATEQTQISKAKRQQVLSAFRRFFYLTLGSVLAVVCFILFVCGIAAASDSNLNKWVAVIFVFFFALICGVSAHCSFKAASEEKLRTPKL